MKKLLKYLFLSAGAAFVLASCEEELIPSKDTYGAYKGVTGTYAYIVDGTMPEYEAVTAAIQHTPIGELGTIERTVDVAVTKVQEADVTITLGVDNTALESGYEAFPEGILKYENSVTIPAGETSASVTVSVDNADFPSLTAAKYMAAFRITDATGVEVSSNSNLALLYVTTETIDPRDNVVALVEETHTFSITNYTDAQTGDDIWFSLDVTGTEPAFQDFDVVFGIDNDLIAAYNEENGTSYLQIPDGVIELGTAKMAEDATETSLSVSVDDESKALLKDAPGYLVPITIESAGESTLGTTVVYVIINVTNFDYDSNMFSALYLADKEMACWYKFSQGIDMTDGFLYIFHMFIDENVGQQRVGNIADKDEVWINMLRLGQRNNGEELEWWVGPNNNRKNLYADVTAGEWHQIGLYYNGDNYIIYVDKVEQARYELTEEDKALNDEGIVFQGIEFANSWGDQYRSPFNGRLWNWSVWQGVDDTSVSDILDNTYQGMDESFLRYAQRLYGLKAFWPMDEGQGAVLHDECGWEDIDFTKATRCNDEVTFVPFDASPYVQWVADENNRLGE